MKVSLIKAIRCIRQAGKIAIYCSLVVLGAFSTFARADEDLSDNDIYSMTLEELLSLKVGVASNAIKDGSKRPVSISIIDREKISFSGARTLNELLSIYVPGFFMVEDQDDTIAGFRGLVPDNNSKTLLLLDGVSMNTEWFWGAPDAVLNGMDLGFIERVEVIRGPGSVTLGQGALLGVINIVTKKRENNSASFNISDGADGFNQYSLDFGVNAAHWNISGYYSEGDYDGQPIENRGWANARIDQGLSVYQRQHRLKRSKYTNYLVGVKHEKFSLHGYHFDQTRDLYNFFRDREVVGQTVNGLAANYAYDFSPDLSLTVSANYTQDDYALYSHGNNIESQARFTYESVGSGFSDIANASIAGADAIVEPDLIMGGTRETRTGAKIIVNANNLISDHQIAIGAEINDYKYGQKNASGNNFIINEAIQRLGITSDGMGGVLINGNVNQNNAWVKPASVNINSIFLEDFFAANSKLDLLAAFRFDDHPNWGNQLTPRIGAFYQLNETQRLRFVWQTGFRGAVGVQFDGGFVQDGLLAEENFNSLNQISTSNADFDFDGIAANDDKRLQPLEPETMESFELEHRYFVENYSLKSILFFNRVKDILAAEANGYQGLGFGDLVGSDEIGTWNGNWYYQNQNGRLEQIGFELEWEYQTDNLTISSSHAYVSVARADQDVIGVYVLQGKKNSAYPENISRFNILYHTTNQTGEWKFRYNHLYYWQYDAPTGLSVDGNHLANLGISWKPPVETSKFHVDLTVKNIWNANNLYPIIGTGDLAGADGAPTVESRTWWLTLGYTFH